MESGHALVVPLALGGAGVGGIVALSLVFVPTAGAPAVTGAAVQPLSGLIEGTMLSLLGVVTVLIFASIGAFIGVLLDWRRSQ